MSSWGGVFTLEQPSAIPRGAHALSQEVWSVPGELRLPGASSWHVCRISELPPTLPFLPVTFYHVLRLAELWSLMTWLRSHQYPRECSRTHLLTQPVSWTFPDPLFPILNILCSHHALPLHALQPLITSCIPDGSLSFSLCRCSPFHKGIACLATVLS